MDTDVVKIRAMIAQMRASKPASDPATLPYTQRDIEIPVRDGRTVPARVYTPREESGTATTGGGMAGSGRRGMVVFHGGGYAVGDAETEEWLCAAFARLGGVSVNVEYRLSPEWAFPAAAHDALDATRWVAAEAARGGLGVDPERGLLVGGESGGADLALAVAAECARAGDLSPPLAGIYAAIPSCIDARTAGGRYAEYLVSKEQCARAPLLTRQSMEFIECEHFLPPYPAQKFRQSVLTARSHLQTRPRQSSGVASGN